MRFGSFTLDLDTRQLTRDGREIHLSPKAFALLVALVQHRPSALSKADLQERLWPGTFVSEANLSNLVAEIRAAIDDLPRAPMFIRTVHGHGYAFCGEVTPTGPTRAGRDVPPCWLEWGRRQIPLTVGEHVLGRDDDAEIRLNESTVSRHHARLIVAADGTHLEDCASKNGTFRGSDRVTTPVPLADGDAIRIGSVLLTFRVRSAFASTATQADDRS